MMSVKLSAHAFTSYYMQHMTIARAAYITMYYYTTISIYIYILDDKELSR